MRTTEQQIEEAKKIINETQGKLAELEIKLKEEQEVTRLFPIDTGVLINSRGERVTVGHSVKSAKQGNTFYTSEELEKESLRREARAYCLEEIHRVNKGDDGFKKGGDNHLLSWEHYENRLGRWKFRSHQHAQAIEYIRTNEGREELMKSPEFVKNWKIWKGIDE